MIFKIDKLDSQRVRSLSHTHHTSRESVRETKQFGNTMYEASASHTTAKDARIENRHEKQSFAHLVKKNYFSQGNYISRKRRRRMQSLNRRVMFKNS